MKIGGLILALFLRSWAAYDVCRALQSGKARSRVGTITRKSRPKQFRLYIIGDCLVVVFCLASILTGLGRLRTPTPGSMGGLGAGAAAPNWGTNRNEW
jgi:hypothetical protein